MTKLPPILAFPFKCQSPPFIPLTPNCRPLELLPCLCNFWGDKTAALATKSSTKSVVFTFTVDVLLNPQKTLFFFLDPFLNPFSAHFFYSPIISNNADGFARWGTFPFVRFESIGTKNGRWFWSVSNKCWGFSVYYPSSWSSPLPLYANSPFNVCFVGFGKKLCWSSNWMFCARIFYPRNGTIQRVSYIFKLANVQRKNWPLEKRENSPILWDFISFTEIIVMCRTHIGCPLMNIFHIDWTKGKGIEFPKYFNFGF